MDYFAFIGVVFHRTAAQLELLNDPPTRALCGRVFTQLVEEERLVTSYLTCAQCHALHLSPARLHACIAWAKDAEEVFTTLAQAPCPPASVG